MRKTYLYTITACTIIMMISFPVGIAKAAEGMGSVGIKANYSSSITAKEGDTFSISYEESETGESGSIEVDAYELRSEFRDYEVPPGSYDITDIEYTGSNEEIINEGYGIENSFRIKEAGDDDILHVYIGADEVEGLEKDYNQAVIKDSEHDENGDRIVYEDENGKYRYEEDESGNTFVEYIDEDNTISEGAGAESSSGMEASSQPEQTGENAQEPITEYYEEENKETNEGSIFMTLGLCAVVGLVGIIILLVLHKIGKI